VRRVAVSHPRRRVHCWRIHGTHAAAPTSTGARDALAYALFHPAAALRSTDVERQSYDDIAGLPRVLTEARARRASARTGAPVAEATPEPTIALAAASAGDDLGDDAPTLF